jgi:hypothetical protein
MPQPHPEKTRQYDVTVRTQVVLPIYATIRVQAATPEAAKVRALRLATKNDKSIEYRLDQADVEAVETRGVTLTLSELDSLKVVSVVEVENT